jgi:hypothetical protein
MVTRKPKYRQDAREQLGSRDLTCRPHPEPIELLWNGSLEGRETYDERHRTEQTVLYTPSPSAAGRPSGFSGDHSAATRR